MPLEKASDPISPWYSWSLQHEPVTVPPRGADNSFCGIAEAVDPQAAEWAKTKRVIATI
jgi:hypothetical protein